MMILWNLTYKIKLTSFKKLDKKYLFVDVQQLQCAIWFVFVLKKTRQNSNVCLSSPIFSSPIFLENESVYYLSNNAWWNYSKAEFTCLIYGSISIYESLTDPYKYLLMDSISMTLFFENFLSTSFISYHP